jgi:hypothetical protein
MKHSVETIKILKENGLANIEIFKKYAHLGPAASSKKVICLDDGKIFSSASEAARIYGVAKSALI